MALPADNATMTVRTDRLFTSIAVLLAVLMVILDMTVVNVALPHMMGALGATPDQITWVITSYIVAEAVVIPVSGFLAARFGRKRVIIVSVIGFIAASMLCGQATTLAQMVLFRLLQGAFGASVVPLSQAVMVDMFSAEDRGKAMAIWGIGILLGPIMGPTVGGFITDHLDWRWVFYINLPIGILNLALLSMFLETTPRVPAVADWLGALLLAVGVGALQMMLDRGNTEDWWQSHFIVSLACVSLFCLSSFVARSYRNPRAVLQIDLLRDRNLATATLMIMAFGVGMLSTIALQPLFLEHMLGYPAATAGLLMAPRGIAVAVGMTLVATLITRVQPRWLVLTGLVLAAVGSYVMTWYSLNIDTAWIIAPGVVQGIGMGMIFVPLSALAYQTLPTGTSDQAASIFNLARTVGGSVGVAIAATVLTRTGQLNWQALGAGVDPGNPALQGWLNATGANLADPATVQMLGIEVFRQSTLLGFIEAFGFVTLAFLLLVPLVWILKRTTVPARSG
jgi:MFS transporter, DHA2 family, multidrug resistance protein